MKTDLKTMLCALLTASLFEGPFQAIEPKEGIYGYWRTVAILGTADVVGMSDRNAHKLIGQCLAVERDAVKFAAEICTAPSYEQVEREPVRYLREQWHAPSGRLQLPDPVAVIDAGCTDFFMRNPTRLVFIWKGYFFEARRAEASECRHSASTTQPAR